MQQLYIAIIKITSSQHIQLYKILNVSSKISTEKRELQIFFQIENPKVIEILPVQYIGTVYKLRLSLNCIGGSVAERIEYILHIIG